MKKYLVWLWRNTTGIRMNMLVRIVAGFGRVAFGLTMVWLCKHFIDVTIRKGTTDDIIMMIAALVGVIIGGIICRQIYYFLGVKASVAQSTVIRLRIFSHLFRRQMFEQKGLHSGDVTSRLEKDIDVVSDATTSMVPDFTVIGIQLVGAFLLMQSMDARLAWALLLLTPVFLIVGKLFARKMRQMTLEIRHQESVIQMLVQETMEHNAVLRSLESGDWITGRLDGMQQNLKGKVNRRARFTVVSRLLIASSFSFGYIIAFIWGAMQLRAGIITFGVMTSFLQLVGMIQNPILQLLNMIPGVIHATASVDRLEELENEKGMMESKDKSSAATGIRFSDVSFCYADGDRMVVDHFTHDFKPGTKTAIMGETGIGKTTLFRMILGFIQPSSGHVEVGGDLCFVPQGNTLMSGTIRYNLQLAKPEADDEELLEALHTACADFVADLPEGLDTELGERGSGLSEGQAQRIAIARGLLHGGDVLLLDEISSSLDEPTELELYRRLFTAHPQTTMIFITHRSTITALCDEIIRL